MTQLSRVAVLCYPVVWRVWYYGPFVALVPFIGLGMLLDALEGERK